MKKLVCTLFVLLLVFIHLRVSGAAESRSDLTVAGFVNIGDPGYSFINPVMSVSLILYLSKIYGSVTTFSSVEKEASNSGFWQSQSFDPFPAVEMARTFGSRHCITGTYRVENGNRLSMNLYLFDIANRQVLLEKSYRWSSTKDILGTVDIAVRDILEKMTRSRQVYGRVRVRVPDSAGRYQVHLNGNYIADAGTGKTFEYVLPAGHRYTLALVKNGREVLRESVAVVSDDISELSYEPKGALEILNAEPGLEILVDGKTAGFTDSSGKLVLFDLDAARPVSLEFRKGGWNYLRKGVLVGESALSRIDLQSESPVLLELTLVAGLKLPIQAFCSVGPETGFSSGVASGRGFSLTALLMRTFPAPGVRAGIEFSYYFANGSEFLSGDLYESGSAVYSDTANFGANLVLNFSNLFYAGAGALMENTYSGYLSAPSGRRNLTEDRIGKSVYLTAVGGYAWELVQDQFYLPLEARIQCCLTSRDAVQIGIGISLGVSYRFDVSPQWNPGSLQGTGYGK